jgi:EAL domain-containing protein (putative c-di-GMP-specific phosphodiesterase class I)
MNTAANQQPRMQEQALLNHIKRLERAGGEHMAVQVHLSKLLTFQRLPECFSVVRTMLARDAKKCDASLYAVENNDLFLIYSRDALVRIEDVLARVCQVLGIDPFFAAGDSTVADFCTYFDLSSEFGELVDRVQALIQARTEREHLARTAKKTPGVGKPLELSNLAALEKAISQADLSGMTSRQAICEVGEDGRPVPLFYELFTSIGALRQTLMPDQDLFSDHWLFQYLTTKLDQRMLAWLSKNDDATLKHSFSLNINIASLLSPRFLEFDALLDKTRRNTIVIEMQKMDVFADIARFLFVREFLKDRGYRICLDGLTALSLPYVERQKLGFDLVKLHWTPQLRQQMEGKDGDTLRAAIEASNPRRIVMMRCESDDAVELGHQVGISLFQGYYLDHLLSEKITREEAAERLSAALARHRRVAAPAQAAS